jgi:hypothetical protein
MAIIVAITEYRIAIETVNLICHFWAIVTSNRNASQCIAMHTEPFTDFILFAQDHIRWKVLYMSYLQISTEISV